MAKFTIQPHGRLQEWIAHEKGYFRDADLDYEFRGGLSAERKKEVDASGKIVDVFSARSNSRALQVTHRCASLLARRANRVFAIW